MAAVSFRVAVEREETARENILDFARVLTGFDEQPKRANIAGLPREQNLLDWCVGGPLAILIRLYSLGLDRRAPHSAR